MPSTSEALESVEKYFTECCHKTEEQIRSSPIPSILTAAAIGYILRFIPITAILAGLVSLLLALAKPLIVCFGAFKLYEFIRSHTAGTATSLEVTAPLQDAPVEQHNG